MLTGQLGADAPRSVYRHRHQDKWVFALLVFFLLFSVAAIAIGQKTGIGVVKVETTAPAAVRDIILKSGPNDTVIVLDANDGSLITSYSSGEGGFVRGSLRAFDRMRLVARVPNDAPYRLIQWEHGTVSLSDISTGERFYLNAFGPDNAAAFAKLLEGYGQ